ncbi:TetR/AcrR family transcriptional regulator [Mesorhizobium sp. M0833]|uniref:TetR/AcrR family transcriptional regulator n=1 Tax=Mesorhizobium sp. M0833 TaxID=2957009 RepID=UPI00333D052C
MESKKAAPGRPATMQMPRETILTHASRLFAENGYERTALRDVAASVGLSKAAVYHYFPTKQVIYDAIVADLLENLHNHVVEQVGRYTDDRSRLKAFMVAHAEFFERHHSEFITLLHGVSGIGTAQSSRQVEVRDRYERFLRGLLSEGTISGAFIDCDVAIPARAILSMLNWMSRWFDPRGARRATAFASEYFEFFYRGLMPR